MMKRWPEATALLWGLLAPAAAAQGTAFDVRLGQWDPGQTALTVEAMFAQPALGPIWFGAGGLAIIDDDLGGDDAFYGGAFEFTFFKHTSRFGPYAVLGAAVGAHTGLDPTLGVSWSAGAGMEWNPFAFVGLSAEIRYRAQDQGFHGFWNLEPGARKSLSIAAGITARWGFTRTPTPRTSVARPTRIEGNALAVGVVETALDVMGTPYQWGGTDGNGFDCSGLVQYAYGEHGISLPRVSREQARVGSSVPRDLVLLAPGDILAFSAVPGGQVTHVGLYVGQGRFIHSSSRGVVLSELAPSDVDGGWWWRRWTGVRRVLGAN